MAHQAHALPWQTLADNFKFVYCNKKYKGVTNLYPCFKPGQGKQLQHFAGVFATLLDDFSAQERRKYPNDLVPPTDDEVFIPDPVVTRIAKTVRWYKTRHPMDMYTTPSYQSSSSKDPPLPDSERKIPYWVEMTDECYCIWPKPRAHECIELLKTLLLYGEMEPLFRLATHPDLPLPPLYSFPWEASHEYGWADVKDCALTAYLCLNMFLAKPELHDAASRAYELDALRAAHRLPYAPHMHDYRNTKAYQKMLVQCTWTRSHNAYEVCSLPHREFFGIDAGMVTLSPLDRYTKDRLGAIPPTEVLNTRYRAWHVPTTADVSAALHALQARVPAEIALEILELAGYTAKRRVPVAHDPLHPDNAEELGKYLRYCWKLLARVDMLVKETGQWIDWEFEVTDAIFNLWGVPYPKMSTTVRRWDYPGSVRNEIDSDRVRRVFD